MNIHRFSRRVVCPFKSHIVIVLTALLMSVQFFDAVLGVMDLDVAATIVSADASLHTPEGDFFGYEGAGQFAASLRNSFSEVRFVTQEPSLTGDLATVQWTMTGFHTSDYQGLAGGGAPISLHGLAVLRFDDRVIVEQWIEYDRLALVDQIEMFALIDSCDAECLKPNENR